MKELTILSGMRSVSAAQTAADAGAIAALNLFTGARGLTLTERDAREIAETRQKALRENERVELGVGAVEKLILVFSQSAYTEPRDWAELCNTLVECFYFIKTETHDTVHDNELIRAMLDEFEGHCEGSIAMFESRMEMLARKLCGGGDADE